jgi:hypothetical protein
MKVIHYFEYAWPEGVAPITLDKWVLTLSKDEQHLFNEAERRQRSYRSQTILNGDMSIVDSDSYAWRDEETANRNKGTDQEWLAFFKRYIQETQTIFTKREEREK